MLKIFTTPPTTISGTVESPDFSGIPSYAIAAVQAAFEAGNYEFIPDPEPVEPTPEPQWTPFNIAMLGNTYWQNWTIPADVRTAMISAFVNGKQDAAQSAYDVAKGLVVPAAEAVLEWQALADQYFIPIVL